MHFERFESRRQWLRSAHRETRSFAQGLVLVARPLASCEADKHVQIGARHGGMFWRGGRPLGQ
jgi:hypothetical protein